MIRFVPWTSNNPTPAATRLSITGLLLLMTGTASCLELGDKLQIHGFASQAFTLTNHNQVFGKTSDGGSLGYTELGINGSYRPLPSLMLSAQALSRRAGETDDGHIRLDYGFVDYTAFSNEDRRWGIRAGRMKNPYGLYNETRDIAFTRPTIFLPQGIYFEQIRPLVLSSDGIGLYGEERTQFGDFHLQTQVVRLDADNKDTELGFLGFDAPGEFDNDHSFVGQLLYEYDGGRVRAALSIVKGTLDYKPTGRDFLTNGELRITPIVASLQYNAEDWSITGEYLRESLDYQDFGPAFPFESFTAASYYLQGSYRFMPAWEALIRYDVFHPDKDDTTGRKFLGTGIPSHHAFSTDWTAGLRWDINAHAMVRAEFHRIDGTAGIPLQDNPDPSQWTRRWNMFSVQIGLRF